MKVYKPWSISISDILHQLDVNPNTGLLYNNIEERIKLYGKNELLPPPPKSIIKLIIKQFNDPLVMILLSAAFVSFLLAIFDDDKSNISSFIEPIVILLILIANATVGVIQETNAEKAIESLKQFEAKNCCVLRNSEIHEIDSSLLVPGDIIELKSGDKIPADCRVINILSSQLCVDESLLNGECENASKQIEIVEEDVVNQDKTNMVFSGTLITKGSAKAVVVETGSSTVIGSIHKGLLETEEVTTPLQQKLDEFSETLSKIIGVICILVWLVNVGHFSDPINDQAGNFWRGAVYYFKIAVALAVAAIPEGLPAVVTTCLALGTMRLAKKNAIVRVLHSVETLGCTNVICSDKTGTLTTNQMCVKKVLILNNSIAQEFNVEGTSFEPIGKISDAHSNIVIVNPVLDNLGLCEVGKISCLCNDAYLKAPISNAMNGSIELNIGSEYTKVGTSTEAALVVLGEKIGHPSNTITTAAKYWSDKYHRVNLLEFSRDRKCMSVVVQSENCKLLLTKGAPESLLSKCTFVQNSDGTVSKMDATILSQLNSAINSWASTGLRVLALAKSEICSSELDLRSEENYSKIETNLTFVGIVGMIDPPRPEVVDAIATCFAAGLRVIVITGDNKTTAEAICKQIGVFDANENLDNKSYTGAEFQNMSHDDQLKSVMRASLFSRVEPSQKSNLVDLLQSQNLVVAMTGDGVNDAPALAKADIGIAMGTGTAVAREASKMILQDDNFATIVGAIEEGRSIYLNTKQFIRYLISSNIGEVVCIFMSSILGMPDALIPVQLLWVNLVTDGLPATALSFNKADSDVMIQPPRNRAEVIIDNWTLIRYLVIGVYVGLATIFGFIWHYLYSSNGPKISWTQLTSSHSCSAQNPLFDSISCDIFGGIELRHASTIALTVLVVIEMFNALNALSENQSLLSMRPSTNPTLLIAIFISMFLHLFILYVPFLQTTFSVTALTSSDWFAVILISLPIIFLEEFVKWVSRRVYVPISLLKRRLLAGELIPLESTLFTFSNIKSRLLGTSAFSYSLIPSIDQTVELNTIKHK